MLHSQSRLPKYTTLQYGSPRPYNLVGGCAPQAKQRVAKPTPQALKSSMLPKPVSMNDSRTPVHNTRSKAYAT